MAFHKEHLKHSTVGGPTCQRGRTGGSLRGEHFTLSYAEFVMSARQCSRCLASKQFSLLARREAKEVDLLLVIAPLDPVENDDWYSRDRALIQARKHIGSAA